MPATSACRKSGCGHFFEKGKRFRFCGSGHFSLSAKADGREKCEERFRLKQKPPRPRGKAPRYDYSQRACGPSDTSHGAFFDILS